MGFLNLFKNENADLTPRLPSGSFTMDRTGRIVISTVPHSFPEAHVREIGQLVLALFRSAQEQRLPLTELLIQYAGLKLSARDLRGGAIVFLAPREL